ncbi:MAG: glycosyltransferase [Lachnospiraceae bacterium]|nr:glycosyltransferase [Lachnospiraceae bacterium]
MDLISVIIPVYNVETYLQRCLESVVNQTYCNLEIILVDDGSTDSSGAICDSYAYKDKRICVIHKENGGLSDARNHGLSKAQGAYIFFVDADDYIAPETLEILYERMRKDNSDMAVCSYRYVDENGEFVIDKNGENPICDEVLTGAEAIHKLEHHKKWYFTVVWNKLYRRYLFEHIQFLQGKYHEDEYIAHHIYNHCNRISFIHDELYYYVQRTGSITDVKNIRKEIDKAGAMLDRAVFSIEHSLHNLTRICLDDLIQILYGICSYKDCSECSQEYKVLQKKYRSILSDVWKTSIPFGEKLRYFLACINVRLLYKIHNILLNKKNTNFKRNLCKRIQNIHKKRKKCICLLATPEHGNLGDHAIVCSIKQFLRKLELDDCLIEVTQSEYEVYKDILPECIQPSDLILIPGGGNLGTLWPEEDNMIADIVDTYKEHEIVVFPQSCFYEEDELSDARRLRNREVYVNAKNLKVFLRDQISYDVFQRNFPGVQTYLMPDMVAYYECEKSFEHRNTCLLCLRDDKESILTIKSLQKLSEVICEQGYEVKTYSTVRPYMISPKCREREVSRGLREFAQARLVITDRLHGMLFAAISGTPCICTDNISGKVRGQFKWLKDMPYIKFVETETELAECVAYFSEQTANVTYSNETIQPFYERLKQEIMDSYDSVR